MIKPPLGKKPASNADIDALIEKGAPSKSDQNISENKESNTQSDNKKYKFISLRFPAEMIAQIDELVSKNVGINRSGWILQAVQKELKRQLEE